MAAPVIGIRPRYAPRKGATVDQTHPLARGLEFCFIPDYGPTELAKDYAATLVGSPTTAVNAYGRAGSMPTTERYSFAGIPDAPFLGPISLLWVGSTTVGSAEFGMIAGKMTTTSATVTPFAMYLNPTANVAVARANTIQANWYTSNYSLTPNDPHVVLFSLPAAMNSGPCPAWIDGKYYSASGAERSGVPTGNSAAIYVGSRPFDNYQSKVSVNLFAAWSRQVSFAEALALYADPFCFLKT